MSSELKDQDFHDRLTQIMGDDAREPFAWAAKIGIPKATFSRIWKEGTVPGPEHLRRIHEKTGVSIDWLLTGEGPMKAGDKGLSQFTHVAEHNGDVRVYISSSANDDRMRAAIIGEINKAHGKQLRDFMRSLLNILENDAESK